MNIVLATTSPYRIAAMKDTGMPFEAKSSKVEEYFEGRPTEPKQLVKVLSKLKAEAVAKDCPNSLVIGMDSIGYFNGKILEKVKSYEEAFERLKSMSGSSYDFYTGLTVIDTKTKKIKQKLAITHVKMRKITDDEIKRYLEQDPKYNTYAHGYDPWGHLSSTFIKSISGDPKNILTGIPLATIFQMINKVK